MGSSSPAAEAGTINPTTTVDELAAGGECSLREAVSYANDDLTAGGCIDSDNATGDPDTIDLGGGEYDLSLVRR